MGRGCRHNRRRGVGLELAGVCAEERIQASMSVALERHQEGTGPASVAVDQESEAEAEIAPEASSAELWAVCLEDVRGMATELPWPVLPPRLRAHWLAAHRACPCGRAAVPSPPEDPLELLYKF